MSLITIHKAKTNLFQLIKKVSAGEEVIIARWPLSSPIGTRRATSLSPRQPGSLKGKLRVGKEFFEPLPPNESAGWE